MDVISERSAELINSFGGQIHKLNEKWWIHPVTQEPIERNVGEILALIHSEISEALEGHRKDLMDDHLPHRKMFEVELADAMIRIFDAAYGLGCDLGGAFVEKLEYNQTRADHMIEARRMANGKKYYTAIRCLSGLESRRTGNDKMRKLTDHIVGGDQAVQLTIEVTDQPGQGGAYHKYEITGFDTEGNASAVGETGYKHSFSRLVILFQNGPIKEFGVNGITQEALLAIVLDRLRCFQLGPFGCDDNAEALRYGEAMLDCLQRRTRARIARGVEGTNQK